MSNTSKGRAYKGSKYMMQIASSPLLRDLIDKHLQLHLEWLSPIAEDSYQEYEIKNDYILQALGLLDINDDDNREESNNKSLDELFKSWPHRQPQWDGIAIDRIHETLYLFEAKSHIEELNSKSYAKDAKSKDTIKATLENTAKEFGEGTINKDWTDKYYQFANRLAFLKELKKISEGGECLFRDVKLVFINFIKDPTWPSPKKVENKESWEEAYNTLYQRLGIDKSKLKDVIHLYYHCPYIE